MPIIVTSHYMPTHNDVTLEAIAVSLFILCNHAYVASGQSCTPILLTGWRPFIQASAIASNRDGGRCLLSALGLPAAVAPAMANSGCRLGLLGWDQQQ